MPMHFRFANRSMHPALRILVALVGVAVLALLIVFGALALLLLLAVGGVSLALSAWRRREGGAEGADSRSGKVLEGEYVVLGERQNVLDGNRS